MQTTKDKFPFQDFQREAEHQLSTTNEIKLKVEAFSSCNLRNYFSPPSSQQFPYFFK